MMDRPGETGHDEMHCEYVSKSVQGKCTAAIAEGTNLVILQPDVAKAYPASQAANDASGRCSDRTTPNEAVRVRSRLRKS